MTTERNFGMEFDMGNSLGASSPPSQPPVLGFVPVMGEERDDFALTILGLSAGADADVIQDYLGNSDGDSNKSSIPRGSDRMTSRESDGSSDGTCNTHTPSSLPPLPLPPAAPLPLSSTSTPQAQPSVHRNSCVALQALQNVPIPLLVLLGGQVFMSNNALLDLLLGNDANLEYSGSSAGQILSSLGVEMVRQNCGSWDAVLNSIMADKLGNDPRYRARCKSGDILPPALYADLGLAESAKLDVKIYPKSNVFDEKANKAILFALMTISPWIGDDGDIYMALTFTGSSPWKVQNLSGVPAGLTLRVDGFVAMKYQHDFDHRNEPELRTHDISMMKEAMLDVMDIPVFSMWEGDSIVVPNRAGWELVSITYEETENNNNPPSNRDLLKRFRLYTPDFERPLEFDQYPLQRLCTTKQPFEGLKVGVLLANGRRQVYEINGKCINKENGEFLAGLVALKDITDIHNMEMKLKAETRKNELRFRNICDCMPQMIWTTTPDGEHDYFSKRWYDFTGLAPEQCLGLGWRLGYHPEDAASILETWKHSLATGNGYTAEYRCRRHDGEYRWMLGRALPFRDPETGEIVKWYGTTTDIHDMVEARKAERSTREHLLEVLTHAKLALWAVDEQQRVTILEGGKLWGNLDDPKLYYGAPIKDVFEEIDPEKKSIDSFLEPIEPLLQGKIAEDLTEIQLDGRFFKTKYIPIRGKMLNGRKIDPDVVTGVIGFSMDNTIMRAYELELRERESQNRILQANENAAKEASKLKSEFLASMSHEIRTPIAGVVGMCDILLDTVLSEEQREFAEGIQRSANALLTVINDILDLSKVESGRMDIEEVQFNLSLVIHDVVKMVSFDADRKKLRFIHFVEFPEKEDMKVMGDPGRVRQILLNLMSNAVKFTPEGEVELKVFVEVEDDSTITISFCVKDSGIGISEEDQHKLFQPFTQADSSTARRFGGTGLGLTICRNLVTLMGGKIGLASSAGTGTTAYFTIPFKKLPYGNSTFTDEAGFNSIPERLQSDLSVSCRSSETGTATPPDSLLDPFATGGSGPKPSLLKQVSRTSDPIPGILSDREERRKRHVLVVEDNEINQQIAIRLIKKLDFTVTAVSNGLEALEFVNRSTALPPSYDDSCPDPPSLRRPDIILMDVQMPEMDGYSATKAIRTGKLSRPCPSPTSEPASILNYIQNSLAAEHLRDSGVKDWLGTVPIVAMTASAIKGDRQKCKDAGMDDYIAKPVRVDMLEKMLVKWCSAAVTQSRANPVVWDGLKALEYGPERPSIGSKSLRPSPGNTIQNNAIPVGGPGPGKKIGSIATALGETPAPAETPQGVRMVRQRGHLQEL